VNCGGSELKSVGLHSFRAVGLRQFLLRKLARSIRSFGSLRIPVRRRSGVYYVGEVLLKVVQRTLIVRVSDDTGLGRLRGLRLSIPVLRDFLDALNPAAPPAAFPGMRASRGWEPARCVL